MHRWLIAIFALHFVLNVSAFSLGDASLRTTDQASWIAASASVPAAETCRVSQAAASDQSPSTHGLLDELPDLPDTLARSVPVLRQPVEPGHTIHYVGVHHALLLLDAPLRPPRSPGA